MVKKLVVAAVLSMFSASAAWACDGMKDHAQKTDTQAKKETKKDEAAKGTKS